MSAALIDVLRERLGPHGVLTGADAGGRHVADASGATATAPAAVLRPATTDDVAFILRACSEAGQPLVIQGGLTGLCGGATPQPGEMALSLERMHAIEEVDAAAMTMTVQAGTPLEAVQNAAAEAGLRFPLDLGARGSCAIGGNLSTNAGGNEVIRYGMARALVLGLEVVLADGTVITSLNKMLKNNAGYDLKHLFIGSEGTLGVITRAVLRLFPRPLTRHAALCGLGSLDDVIRFLHHAQLNLAGGLSAFEVMWDDYVNFVIANVREVTSPFREGHPIYVLIEYEGSQEKSDAGTFTDTLEEAVKARWVRDAAIAKSEKDMEAFWRIRDGVAEVLPKLARIGVANFDISVPLGSVERLLRAVQTDLTVAFTETTKLAFGHLGDSNLHLLISTGNPEDTDKVYDMVYRRVGELDGSISAEHGIGIARKKHLHRSRSAEEIALMRRLKDALDPKGILNPGRVLP
jgi:FAD/FMN-containing dehydrogenase